MRDSQDREGSFRRFAVIAVAFVLLVAILSWRQQTTTHIAPNPGPSGTPGSTALDGKPPPAEGPTETTAGMAR
jgi:hypothetical protein